MLLALLVSLLPLQAAESTVEGIYFGFFGARGVFGIFVRSNQTATMAFFNRDNSRGFLQEGVGVNADGSFAFVSEIGDMISGTLAADAVTGIVENAGLSESFQGSKAPADGFLTGADGLYTGPISGDVSRGTEDAGDVTGRMVAIVAADGQGFAYLDLTITTMNGSANGPLAGPITISSLGGISDSGFSGTLDTATLTASGEFERAFTASLNVPPVVFSLTFSLTRIEGSPPLPSSTVVLVASVLPTSRSVQPFSNATAFATLINAGNALAMGCKIELMNTLPAIFSFQTTNRLTNAITGTADTPVDIPAGELQTFVISLLPLTPFNPTDVHFRFVCINGDPAAEFSGVNTLLLSAATTPVPDVIALAATTSGDGTVHLPGATGSAAFSVATANVGAAGEIRVLADTGSLTLPVNLAICEIDPATAVCINPTVPTLSPVVTTVTSGATAAFAVIVTGLDTVGFDPANNRIVVKFLDTSGVVRGSTSVAVRTQ
jgi:hypothetical protein